MKTALLQNFEHYLVTRQSGTPEQKFVKVVKKFVKVAKKFAQICKSCKKFVKFILAYQTTLLPNFDAEISTSVE